MGKLKKINTEEQLFKDVARLIDESKQYVAHTVNTTLTFLYWRIGKRINSEVLQNKRAEYGNQIVVTMSRQLVESYGNGFAEKSIRRMIQFSEVFPNKRIVASLMRQLSWTHFTLLLPLKQPLQEEDKLTPDLVFRDPYFLDFLGLKNTFSEKKLEDAILRELENFILELGQGFSFLERQKKMIIDGEDFKLDLLFYHRKLKRLVAIDLKLGKFKAGYKSQMELYLRWLEKNEMQADEEMPIGLILCAEGNKEQIELLQLNKVGIKIAEYLTELPSKKLLQQKLHQAIEISKKHIENNE